MIRNRSTGYRDHMQLSFEALNTMQQFLNQIGKVTRLLTCRSNAWPGGAYMRASIRGQNPKHECDFGRLCLRLAPTIPRSAVCSRGSCKTSQASSRCVCGREEMEEMDMGPFDEAGDASSA